MTIFEDLGNWLDDNFGVGLDLWEAQDRFSEGDDVIVLHPLKLAEAYRDVYMKGGNDQITVQLGDYFSSMLGSGTISGDAGVDTVRLWIDGNRTLNFVQANYASDGQAVFKATVTAPGQLTQKIDFYTVEKFDILGSYNADTINTSNGNDKVTAGGGKDVVNTGLGNDQIAGEDGDDTLDSGSGDDYIWGGNGNDTIVGGVGSDFIEGGFGNDTIYASPGTGDARGEDQVYGGSGNDTIYDRGGEFDEIYGGFGNDKVIVTGDWGDFFSGDATAAEAAALGSSGIIYFIPSVDTLSVDLKTTLTGQTGWNFNAQAGVAQHLSLGKPLNFFKFKGFEAYEVSGSLQNDTISTGSGNDVVYGNRGNDKLYGNVGADTLRGNEGDDLLSGGTGFDTLIGGTGKDSFLFNSLLAGDQPDKIYDFSAADDTIQIDNAVFTKLANGPLAATSFVTGTKALDGNDFIIYNKTTGVVSYDANGSAAGGIVEIAVVTAGLNLSNADFLVI